VPRPSPDPAIRSAKRRDPRAGRTAERSQRTKMPLDQIVVRECRGGPRGRPARCCVPTQGAQGGGPTNSCAASAALLGPGSRARTHSAGTRSRALRPNAKSAERSQRGKAERCQRFASGGRPRDRMPASPRSGAHKGRPQARLTPCRHAGQTDKTANAETAKRSQRGKAQRRQSVAAGWWWAAPDHPS
jgi:hypothetical protein